LYYDGSADDGEVEDYKVYIEEYAADFGDAPAPYPTYMIDDGAYHGTYPDPNYYLGLLVDIELDGQPDVDALGDDINDLDDEDGVSFLTPLIPGESATIEVIASKEGYLNAWLDYSGVNEWDELEERIFIDEYLLAGINQLIFDIPFDASPGTYTYARFRFDSQGGLYHHGWADDGEVEDYRVYIGEYGGDFGDAPVPYPTLSIDGGASHSTYPDASYYLDSHKFTLSNFLVNTFILA